MYPYAQTNRQPQPSTITYIHDNDSVGLTSNPPQFFMPCALSIVFKVILTAFGSNITLQTVSRSFTSFSASLSRRLNYLLISFSW